MLCATRWLTPGLIVAAVLCGCDRKPKSDPNEFKAGGAKAESGKGGAADGAAKAASATKAPAPADESQFKNVGKFLPRPEAAAGWKQGGKVRYFNGENLYELINGAAEQYREYGFKELATTDYNSAQAGPGKSVTIEIYEMNDALGAFGLFSRQTADAQPQGGGSGGVAGGGKAKGKDADKKAGELEELAGSKASLGEGQILLWKDKYFVRVNWLDESAKADSAGASAATAKHLKPIAEALAKRLPGQALEPASLRNLPSDGRIPESVVYYPKQVPQLEGVGPGISVSYDHDKQKWTTVIVEGDAPIKAAQAALKKLVKGGKAVKELGADSISGPLEGDRQLVAARKGGILVILFDTKGAPKEERLPAAEKVTWVKNALAEQK